MENGNEALIEAIAKAKIDDVVALLLAGVSPDGAKAPEGVDPFGFKESPLVTAMIGGNSEIVALLLSHKAAIYDAPGGNLDMPPANLIDNALHHLVDNWNSTASESMCRIGGLLLDAGVDINALDSSGNTALHKAVWRNQMDSCVFLLDCGADPTIAADDLQQETPIGDALQLRRLDMLKAMQTTCATSHIPMSRLFTPLHELAARGQWGNTALELMAMGVDINGIDISGKRPIDHLPKSRGHGGLVAFYSCIAMGAKPSPQMLERHGNDTLIGEAIRADRVLAAAICGGTGLVQKALAELPQPADPADLLRVWIAGQSAAAVLAEL